MTKTTLRNKTLRQLRTQRFPNAYFLDDGALFQVRRPNWRHQSEVQVPGFQRIERRVRDAVRELVDQHNTRLHTDYTNHQRDLQIRWQDQQLRRQKGAANPAGRAPSIYIPQDEFLLASSASFRLFKYLILEAESGYNLFLCRHHGCERLFTLAQACESGFNCPNDGTVLTQLAHVWVHAACGRVLPIEPEKCYNPGCDHTMRLHLQLDNLARSYWWCAHCYQEHVQHPSAMREYTIRKSDNTVDPGYRRSFSKTCPKCAAGAKANGVLDLMRQKDDDDTRNQEISDQTGGLIRMTPTTARSVYKPASLTVISIENEDPTALIYEWFGGQISDDELRTSLQDARTRTLWDSDEDFRRKLRETDRQLRAAKGPPIPDIHPKADSILRDYEGARRSEPQDLATLRPEHAQHLAKEFGVRASFLKKGISIVDITYGYLVGSSDPERATFQPFSGLGEDVPLLGEKLDTEAILFELDPQHILDWLLQRGVVFPTVISSDSPVQCMRRHLLTCDSLDPIAQLVATLAHTMSHVLIRSSERYTGISRDSLYEMIWARGLAFLLYSGERVNLGMLESCFEGNLHRWFYGARADASHCPHDPLCASDTHAACHACLYLNERNCTEFWNKWLDRRILLSFNSREPGYWGLPR